MKKIDYYTQLFTEATNKGLLTCPLQNCDKLMEVQGHSLCCQNGHLFDLSAKGTLNFSKNTQDSGFYDKELFANRSEIFRGGFFTLLYKKILEIVKSYHMSGTVADFGCGEGSGLRYVVKNADFDMGIAMDLANEGIKLGASGECERILWLIADLANAPLKENSMDCILNVLSPASYKEFDRVLKKDGLLIKVIPEKNYLIELRDYFFNDNEQKTYSNKDVVDIFKTHYGKYSEEVVAYQYPVDAAFLQNLINMTPLTKNYDKAKVELFLKSGVTHITCDFKILYKRES